MATVIDRTNYNLLVDDTGGAIPDGTNWNKNQVKIVLLDAIDAMFASAFVFGSTVTATTMTAVTLNSSGNTNVGGALGIGSVGSLAQSSLIIVGGSAAAVGFNAPLEIASAGGASGVKAKFHASGGFSVGGASDPGATNFSVVGTSAFTGTVTAVAVAMSGLLTNTGFGTHNFSGVGVGNSIVQIVNTNVTANNTVAFRVSDGANYSGYFQGNTTATGIHRANGVTLYADGAGGLVLGATNAAGAIRIYTVSTLRGTITNAGVLDWVGAIQTNVGATLMDATGFAMAAWPTTATAANAHVGTTDYIRQVTSLRAAKRDIRSITLEEASRVVSGLDPVLYRSRVDQDQRLWPGFIAEDVDRVAPDLTMRDEDGELQSVAYDRVSAYLVRVIQHQESRIRTLEARLLDMQDPEV